MTQRHSKAHRDKMEAKAERREREYRRLSDPKRVVDLLDRDLLDRDLRGRRDRNGQVRRHRYLPHEGEREIARRLQREAATA